MFSILDALNRILSFLNINSKFKNKLYTFFGFFTTGYIGYLAWHFISNQAYARGVLYVFICLFLVYFLLLNFLYYFTDRSVKWDISPLFEKFIVEHEEEKNSRQLPKPGKYGEHLVIYDQEEELNTLPTFKAEAALTREGEEILQQMAQFMLDEKLVTGDYGGVTEKNCKEKTYQFPDGFPVPSSTLEERNGTLELWVGLNAMERRKIGSLKQVMDQGALTLAESYQLKPVHVKIFGGAYLTPGRSGVIHGKDSYQLELDVICLNKD